MNKNFFYNTKLKYFYVYLCLLYIIFSFISCQRVREYTREVNLGKYGTLKFVSPVPTDLVGTAGIDREDPIAEKARKKGVRWYFIKEGHRIQLEDKVRWSIWNIPDEMIISPNYEYLAVLSSAEGHPLITILDISYLLKSKKLCATMFIDPYPGWINIEKWENNRLIVSSDMLLTHRIIHDGTRVPNSLQFEKTLWFSIQLPTKKIIPISDEAKHPAKYFQQMLESDNVFEQEQAMESLELLGKMPKEFK